MALGVVIGVCGPPALTCVNLLFSVGVGLATRGPGRRVQAQASSTSQDPAPQCYKIIYNFAKLEGMRIAPGFTAKARNLTGGPKGCAHLSGLLMAMASAALQGLWTYRARDYQPDVDITTTINEFLVNTCWVWRQDGPLVDSLAKGDKISS